MKLNNRKVILGMSGGVDSSVAALLLQKQGYEVIGFFMNASPSGKPPWPSTISWENEEATLRDICQKLNIKLIIKDCEQGYEDNVIKPMFRDYEKGLTPNPDILCNNIGKFPSLLKIAKQENADHIATGHYARIKKTKRGYALLQGKDKSKDQSYFLLGLDQKTLSKTLFPIGILTKLEVRQIAKKAGFPNFNKRSSRGVCYLGQIDMKSFLKQRLKPKPGEILNQNDEVIGSHPGTFYFTIGEKIGEKKGVLLDNKLRNAYGGKWYVAKKERGNILVVAPKSHRILKTKSVLIKSFKLVNKKDFPKSRLKARIRHLGKLIPGMLKKEKNKVVFIFSKGQEGVAEGQFIALYKGERLIGGGEIRL
jgi:tRNA-specific 2-thiouridylase